MRTALAMLLSAGISLAIVGLTWLTFSLVGVWMPSQVWILGAFLVGLTLATVTLAVLQ